MSDTITNYLLDLGVLLKEKAVDAKARASSAAEAQGDPFELGRLTAYYEVLSLMTQQADAFGLPRAALSLDGFDPEAELLASGR